MKKTQPVSIRPCRPLYSHTYSEHDLFISFLLLLQYTLHAHIDKINNKKLCECLERIMSICFHSLFCLFSFFFFCVKYNTFLFCSFKKMRILFASSSFSFLSLFLFFFFIYYYYRFFFALFYVFVLQFFCFVLLFFYFVFICVCCSVIYSVWCFTCT